MRFIIIGSVFFLIFLQSLYAGAPDLILKYKAKSQTQKIDLYSKYFLDKPYDFEPLGEGKIGRYSQKPLYRFDRFSCQTYVETIIALSKAKTFAGFKKNMRLIRYQNGELAFYSRNHFPSIDWVPNNIRNGFIKDINAQVVGINNVKTAKGKIELRQWYKMLNVKRIHLSQSSKQKNQQRLMELKHYGKIIKNKTARINYIPKQKLFYLYDHKLYPNKAILNKIPSGTIILFIRHRWPYRKDYGTYMLVSHMGLIIRKNRRLYLRMGRSVEGKNVQQIAFNKYFKVYYFDPTLIGVSLYAAH